MVRVRKMDFLLTITLLLSLLQNVTSQYFSNPLTASSIISDGPSEVQFTSCATGADSPRVFPINSTTYDWWYFDAVSEDANQAIAIVFFTSSIQGFVFDTPAAVSPVNVFVFANFNDGSTTMFPLLATEATITTTGDGASGKWTGSGAEFVGAPDLSTYTVTIENPSEQIQGTIHLESRGPGHYPCDPLRGGVNELIVPHVGWVNVLPAADAIVEMTIAGKKLNFTGNGYHDKNWGDMPFTSAIRSWYWGHGTFGDYNLVFFDAIDKDGHEWVSGYVLKNGEVVGSTCSGISVRPVGSPYPPTLLTPNPDVFTIEMDLHDGTKLHATVEKTAVQIDICPYQRWIGRIQGSVGGLTSSGSALWEQFKVVML